MLFSVVLLKCFVFILLHQCLRRFGCFVCGDAFATNENECEPFQFLFGKQQQSNIYLFGLLILVAFISFKSKFNIFLLLFIWCCFNRIRRFGAALCGVAKARESPSDNSGPAVEWVSHWRYWPLAIGYFQRRLMNYEEFQRVFLAFKGGNGQMKFRFQRLSWALSINNWATTSQIGRTSWKDWRRFAWKRGRGPWLACWNGSDAQNAGCIRFWK